MERTQGERGGGSRGSWQCRVQQTDTRGEKGWLGHPFSFLLNLYYNISKVPFAPLELNPFPGI
jgi:hypothetical protein